MLIMVFFSGPTPIEFFPAPKRSPTTPSILTKKGCPRQEVVNISAVPKPPCFEFFSQRVSGFSEKPFKVHQCRQQPPLFLLFFFFFSLDIRPFTIFTKSKI